MIFREFGRTTDIDVCVEPIQLRDGFIDGLNGGGHYGNAAANEDCVDFYSTAAQQLRTHFSEVPFFILLDMAFAFKVSAQMQK